MTHHTPRCVPVLVGRLVILGIRHSVDEKKGISVRDGDVGFLCYHPRVGY